MGASEKHDAAYHGTETTQPCPAQTGPVWKCGGEPCGCTQTIGHDGDHTCSCGSWWVDSIRRDGGTR